MANRYINSVGGSNTSPYDTWAKGATTLTTAITGSAAGDDFWIASDHAESTAGAVTLTFPGTSASPNRCMSVNRAGTAPPVAADILAGGSVTTTGANALTINGNVYCEGITFNGGTGSTAANIAFGNASNNRQVFKSCAFVLGTSAIGSRIVATSSTTCFALLVDCTVQFGNAAQGFSSTGPWQWSNKPGSTAIAGATLPTVLISSSTANLMAIRWSGLDLSALGSGKTLHSAGSAQLDIVNCKLGASVTVAATPTLAVALGTRVIGSHDTTNVARNEIYIYQGTLTTETTIIRTAGASDGTTAYSWKVVTTANSKRTFPFVTDGPFEGKIWNTSLVSKTLTVHVVSSGSLTDADIWLEVEYLGSASTPVATTINDANATVLTTAANQATSTEAWSSPPATPVYQKLEVTFTPAMVGLIRWRVCVGKASATVYICPKAELT